ncbi:uncharacterized protein LOC124290146 [Haliotis rubra]|uniref:uncharacterized protein LOC124290146 n=1 Tax=Haliotis rubra TaxID=36100 RepID=UPI001EE5AFE8|nr:uncharacterized protein LOC124290146 [Haliotis rubra]XP_046582794.1 uncharacterized protein LOC124290146 [Haliotis rubra]
MSSLVENRAALGRKNSCKALHFRDCSWRKSDRWKLYKGYTGGVNGEMTTLCIKVYRDGYFDEAYCDDIIEMYQSIQKLAEKFNQLQGRDALKIRVIVPQKAVIDKTAAFHNLKGRRRLLSRDEWVLVYEKIDRMKAFVSKEGESRCADGIMDAFVHFTFQETNGELIVSKLRGSKSKEGCVLSCPRVHYEEDVIRKVLSNHTCNDICRNYRTLPVPTVTDCVDTPLMPSAPPLCVDSDSEDDVFQPPCSPSEEDLQFKLHLDNMNQYRAVPYDTRNPLFYDHNGHGISLPPPYSSTCPDGHKVSISGPCCDFRVKQDFTNNNMLVLQIEQPYSSRVI